MGFIVFEEEAFNYLDAQLENFVKRMDRIRERSEDKTMNKWLDTQDVCCSSVTILSHCLPQRLLQGLPTM